MKLREFLRKITAIVAETPEALNLEVCNHTFKSHEECSDEFPLEMVRVINGIGRYDEDERNFYHKDDPDDPGKTPNVFVIN